MPALVDMMKVNMSIRTIHLDLDLSERQLLRGSVVPYLETNRFRPRVRAIQKSRLLSYRAKVLGQALLAVRTDANRLWMLLSGNPEVAFPSSAATIAAAASLPPPATDATTAAANLAAAALTATRTGSLPAAAAAVTDAATNAATPSTALASDAFPSAPTSATTAATVATPSAGQKRNARP
jgi:hypothetical protein